ncbi:putative glycolipid-binding domain-containing protein [Chryseobacterium tongliaoense]|uniref:putative glycolipid-binding domain-containing protein n=1 Tax=Chryseobacterium tongliaoense TaxID=3240933 RepID=UPI0035171C92
MRVLLWKGLEHNSLEHCIIRNEEETITVKSVILGNTSDYIYTVDYMVVLDKKWNVLKFLITSEINGKQHLMTGEKSGNEWTINHANNSDYTGFHYIDISLTPFTNSLPINNLLLAQNEEKNIKVIYIDILKNEIKPVEQKYTNMAKNRYLYMSIESGFSAQIVTDDDGLVKTYPDLFELVAEMSDKYTVSVTQ